MSDKLILTPCEVEIESDTLTDYTTAGLVEYGLRHCGLESEYHLALRLQELRKLALQLIKDSLADGHAISDSTLKLIDVQRETTELKRFSRVT